MAQRGKDEDFYTDSYSSAEDSESYETVVKRDSEKTKSVSIFRCCTRPRTRSEAGKNVKKSSASVHCDQASSSDDSLRSFPRVAFIDQRTGYAMVKSFKPRGHERRYKVCTRPGREAQLYTTVCSLKPTNTYYPPPQRAPKQTGPVHRQPWMDTNTPIDIRDYSADERIDWQRKAEKFGGYRRENVIQWLEDMPSKMPKYL